MHILHLFGYLFFLKNEKTLILIDVEQQNCLNIRNKCCLDWSLTQRKVLCYYSIVPPMKKKSFHSQSVKLHAAFAPSAHSNLAFRFPYDEQRALMKKRNKRQKNSAIELPSPRLV